MGSCAGSKRSDSLVTMQVQNPATATSTSGSTVNGKKSKSIIVNPSQFVRELVGDFREYYDIGKKLGGGKQKITSV